MKQYWILSPERKNMNQYVMKSKKKCHKILSFRNIASELWRELEEFVADYDLSKYNGKFNVELAKVSGQYVLRVETESNNTVEEIDVCTIDCDDSSQIIEFRVNRSIFVPYHEYVVHSIMCDVGEAMAEVEANIAGKYGLKPQPKVGFIKRFFDSLGGL